MEKASTEVVKDSTSIKAETALTLSRGDLLTGNVKPRFFYGWYVVLAGLCIQMAAWGTNITFGIFFKPLLTEFGWTRAMTSGASSFHTICRGLFYLILGRLNDKFGSKILVVICGFLLGLGYILMSQVDAIWQLYLFYGVMVSIGMSASFVPVATTITSWFVKRRGVPTSIFLSGASLGCMIMAPMSNWFIATYGWRTSYIIIGMIGLVMIVSGAQFLKSSPRGVNELPYSAHGEKESILNDEASGLSLQQAIQVKQFWVLCVIIFLGSFCQFTVLVHLVPYAIDQGISGNGGAALLGIATGMGLVGRIAIGITADRIGNKRVLAICFGLLLIDFIWLLMGKKFWMFCLFAILYGLVGSVSVVVPSPMVAELFGLNSHGTILGAVMLGGTIGGAAGPLLAGHLFDITGGYQLHILTCVIFSFACIILSLFLIPTRTEIEHPFGR